MDRSRVITTLVNYGEDSPLADRLRADAEQAGNYLRAAPEYEHSVERLSRQFAAIYRRRDPMNPTDSETLKYAFRYGLETGLSIGAVEDSAWEL